MRLSTLLLCCVLLGMGLTRGITAADSADLTPRWTATQFTGEAAIEEAVVKGSNAERRKLGLSPLAPNTALTIAARQHCREMGEKRYFAHESPVDAAWRSPGQRAYRAGYWGQAVGENIVMVQNDRLTTPQAIATEFVRLWMASPAHRENMLRSDWTLIGVGVVKVGEVYYGGQLFASPLVTLEKATVSKTTGELVELTAEGTLATGIINVWLDNVHQQKIRPEGGRFSTLIGVVRGSGMHQVMIAVGSQVVWSGQLDADPNSVKPLTGVHVYQAGVVTRTAVGCRAFEGLRLTGTLLAPANRKIRLLRDEATVARPTPDKDGRIAFDLILPARPASYTVNVVVDQLLEGLLFIDAGKAPADAFLGRPD